MLSADWRLGLHGVLSIFVVNAGPNAWSSFHVVGAIFDHGYFNANPKNQLTGLQSMAIGPGDGICVELTLHDPGIYPAVNHAFGRAPTGQWRSYRPSSMESRYRCQGDQGRTIVTVRETIQQIDLTAEIARFPPDGPSGRRSQILLKAPSLRVVLITMRAGTELNEHSAPGPITVQPLQGRFAFTAGDDAREIGVGNLVTVDGGVRHAVRALEDGAFLLTIAWPGDAER